MTKPTLAQLLDLAETHARDCLIDHKQEQLIPIFHLCNAEGEGILVAGEFTGDTRQEAVAVKDAVAALVREKIAEHKIVQYSFLSEAWMIVRSAEWVEGVSPPPAEADDRVEVVIATATDGKAYLMRRWRIKRGKDGKCVDLVLDIIDGEQTKPSGRFDSLLVPLAQ